MRRGRCIKCGAETVRAARNALELGEHFETRLRPHLEDGHRGMVRLHTTGDLWAFVCITCGAMELHLLDPAALEFIAEKWIPIAPS